MVARSPSEVSNLTLSEGFVCAFSEGSVGVIGILQGVLARVTCSRVCGAAFIWYDSVGVFDVWLVVVGVGTMLSSVLQIFLLAVVMLLHVVLGRFGFLF